MILIQSPNGSEKCLVDSLEGYDGWTIVAENVGPPPPHCYWCPDANNWKVDEREAARAELLPKVRNPEELADLIADILSRLPSVPE